MPTVIPTQHTENVHSARIGHDSSMPVSMVSAGTAATSPADEIDAPDEAAVWFRLFSRIVSPPGRPRSRSAPFQNANPSNAAVTDMLLLQPIMRPLYTLQMLSSPPSTMPVTTARTVNWRMVRSSGAGISAAAAASWTGGASGTGSFTHAC